MALRLAALATHVRLATRVRARGAEAALHANEPSQRERTGDQQPEERGVEDGVDREAGPNGQQWERLLALNVERPSELC